MRKIFLIMIAVALILTTTIGAFASSDNRTKYYADEATVEKGAKLINSISVNGVVMKPEKGDKYWVDKYGRTMVPVEQFAKAFGGEAVYYKGPGMVTATRGDLIYANFYTSLKPYGNGFGTGYTMHACAEEYNGKAYVSLRSLAQIMLYSLSVTGKPMDINAYPIDYSLIKGIKKVDAYTNQPNFMAKVKELGMDIEETTNGICVSYMADEGFGVGFEIVPVGNQNGIDFRDFCIGSQFEEKEYQVILALLKDILDPVSYTEAVKCLDKKRATVSNLYRNYDIKFVDEYITNIKKESMEKSVAGNIGISWGYECTSMYIYNIKDY